MPMAGLMALSSIMESCCTSQSAVATAGIAFDWMFSCAHGRNRIVMSKITISRLPQQPSFIMPPEESATHTKRQFCKESKYTVDKRKVIELYRHSFQSQETKASRLQMLKCEILPAIFNYWEKNGNPPKDKQDSRTCVKVNLFILC